MTAREVLLRLAVAALLLVVIGAAGNMRAGNFRTPTQRQFHPTPQPRFDWLHHQWLRFCPPFQPDICAGED